MTYEQKSQIMELTDANLSWRQTLRTANNEIKSAKGATNILLIFTISISMISMGLMGWLYYSISKKFEVLKGDLLDMMKTENKIFNKQISIKTDQLSSLIESLSMDVQTLARGPLPDAIEVPLQEMPIALPQVVPVLEPTEEDIKALEGHSPTMPEAPMTAYVDKAMPLDNTMPLPPMPQEPAVIIDLKSTETKLDHIQSLVDKILKAQHQLEASTLSALAQKNSPSADSAIAPSHSALTAEQEKKLNGISWLVRQQDKLLKQIQSTLDKQKDQTTAAPNKATHTLPLKNIEKSLLELSAQVHSLKTQQNEIQQQVEDLQSETQKLSKERPYSYRAR